MWYGSSSSTTCSVQLFILVISHIDYCNSLPAGLCACSVKPLQMIQMQQHVWSSNNQYKLTSLLCLSLSSAHQIQGSVPGLENNNQSSSCLPLLLNPELHTLSTVAFGQRKMSDAPTTTWRQISTWTLFLLFPGGGAFSNAKSVHSAKLVSTFSSRLKTSLFQQQFCT